MARRKKAVDVPNKQPETKKKSAEEKPKKRYGRYSKYRAEKAECLQGHKHDSKKEAVRCNKLHEALAKGEISDLQLQLSYELLPKQTEIVERIGKRGQPLKPKEIVVEKACNYKADFVYMKDGQLIVEDCKGMRTPEYKIKRKLMLYIHNIRIFET